MSLLGIVFFLIDYECKAVGVAAGAAAGAVGGVVGAWAGVDVAWLRLLRSRFSGFGYLKTRLGRLLIRR